MREWFSCDSVLRNEGERSHRHTNQQRRRWTWHPGLGAWATAVHWQVQEGEGESERRCSLKCYHLMSLFVQMKSPKSTHWTLNPVCADLQWLIMLLLFRKGVELTRLSRDIYQFCFDFIYLSTCWITFLLINIHSPPPSSQFHTGSTNSTDSTSTTTVKYVETTTTGDPKPSRGTLQYVVNFPPSLRAVVLHCWRPSCLTSATHLSFPIRNGGTLTACAAWGSPTRLTSPTSRRSRTPSPVRTPHHVKCVE